MNSHDKSCSPRPSSRTEFPEIIEQKVSDGYTVACRFHRSGEYFVTGTVDGRCVLWDADTWGPIKTLFGHTAEITVLDWSRNGRRLLTASKDGRCIVWRLPAGEQEAVYEFSSAIVAAQLYPRRRNPMCVICPQEEAPVMIDLVSDERHRVEWPNQESPSSGAGSTSAGNEATPGSRSSAKTTGSASLFGTTVCFNRKGTRLYMGTGLGRMYSIDVAQRQIVYDVQLTTSQGSIKAIALSHRQTELAICCAADRTIRVYRIREDEACIPQLAYKFQDQVGRAQYTRCVFSPKSDCVVAGSASKSDHNVYIWDKTTGNLNTMLHGPKEGLVDLAFHPLRPILITVSAYGNMFIWNAKYRKNWVDFAPGFQELDENIEYIERENEFDVQDDRRGEETNDPLPTNSVDETTTETIDVETDCRPAGHHGSIETYSDAASSDESGSDHSSDDRLVIPIELELVEPEKIDDDAKTIRSELSSPSVQAKRKPSSTETTMAPGKLKKSKGQQ